MMFLIFVNFVLLSMMQAEGGKLLPTICKQFPDADICSGTDQPAMEQVVDELFSEIALEDDGIVSAIVPFFASAMQQEEDDLISAIKQEGEKEPKQAEREL